MIWLGSFLVGFCLTMGGFSYWNRNEKLEHQVRAIMGDFYKEEDKKAFDSGITIAFIIFSIIVGVIFGLVGGFIGLLVA